MAISIQTICSEEEAWFWAKTAMSLLGNEPTSFSHLDLGIICHSSLQILLSSTRLDGECWWTAISRSLQWRSIGMLSLTRRPVRGRVPVVMGTIFVVFGMTQTGVEHTTLYRQLKIPFQAAVYVIESNKRMNDKVKIVTQKHNSFNTDTGVHHFDRCTLCTNRGRQAQVPPH